jgi:hypothetical protein
MVMVMYSALSLLVECLEALIMDLLKTQSLTLQMVFLCRLVMLLGQI